MKFRLDFIQALRGLAAVIIVLFHMTESTFFYFKNVWLYDIFSLGWTSVDFFFVLSGFIITYIHFNDLKQQKNVSSFLVKRFNRIYPVIWIVTLIYFFFAAASKRYSFTDIFSSYFFKSLFLLPTAETTLVGVSWSLRYEVMFYIVFAVCILLGLKLTKWLVAIWLIAIFSFQLFTVPDISTMFFDGFACEFLLGSITGYLFSSYIHQRKQLQFDNKILLLTGSLLFLGRWLLSYFTSYEGNNAFESRIFYGSASAILILGAALSDFKSQLKVPALFLLIGDASYVIYLLHSLTLAFLYKSATRFLHIQDSDFLTFLFGLFAVVISVLIGIAFHKIVEKPILKFANKLTFRYSNNIPKLE